MVDPIFSVSLLVAMLCSKLDVASFLLPAYWVQTSLNLDHLLFLGSLPCLLCIRCLRDTCIPEDAMLKDPRRLYAPGRIYHIVERKMFRYSLFSCLFGVLQLKNILRPLLKYIIC